MSEHTWKTVLDVIEEELGAKDKRIAELERELASANELNRRAVDNAADFALKLVAAQRELAERPVIESDAAMELHGFLLAHPEYRWDLIRSWRHGNVLVDLILRFIASAPPTSAPSEGDAQRLVQIAEYQDRAMKAEEEVEKLKRELEALKAAPARVEREVEAELRTAMAAHPTWALSDDVLRGNVADETMRVILAGRAWLAAPLSAAPAQDEYTKAAVKYAEASLRYQKRRSGDASELESAAYQALLPLYDARQRGEASAARTNVPVAQSEEHAGSNGVVAGSSPAGDTNQASADHLRDAAKKVEPAPAEERVMVYAKLRPDGTASPAIWSELDRRNEGTLDGEKWLALTATVVREGGGKKGGA